ncbi:hypothetical protein DFH08DRAFT_1025081 [Mycena albidolilacea]|uniref:Uncharacterized protein n=1 Tax=Mycena albidolilacea TaxID=1033008 RepID=A0AAD7AMA5_9AGAR|nr:hypothetical protein DFH08DRAFT_1025081 [Mycena albidolilacea]
MHLASYFWNESSLATAAGAPAVSPPFSLLPPPHRAPSSTFTAVPCDVHGPMRTVLNGFRTRIESWGGQSSDSIGANVAARFLSYYDDPYLSLAVQVPSPIVAAMDMPVHRPPPMYTMPGYPPFPSPFPGYGVYTPGPYNSQGEFIPGPPSTDPRASPSAPTRPATSSSAESGIPVQDSAFDRSASDPYSYPMTQIEAEAYLVLELGNSASWRRCWKADCSAAGLVIRLKDNNNNTDRDGIGTRLPFFRDLLSDKLVAGADAIRSLTDWSDSVVVDPWGG